MFTQSDIFKIRQKESYNHIIMQAARDLYDGKSISIMSDSKEDGEMMVEMIKRAQLTLRNTEPAHY